MNDANRGPATEPRLKTHATPASQFEKHDRESFDAFAADALIAAIRQQADSNGDDVAEVGPERFGLSPASWLGLLNNRRSPQTLTRNQLAKMATYLGRSYVYTLSLANLITPDDFGFKATDRSILNNVYTLIKSNDGLGVLLSAQAWDDTPRETQILVAILYGKLIKHALIPPVELAGRPSQESPERTP